MEWFSGTGKITPGEAPPFKHIASLDDPAGYIAPESLRIAVDTAIFLGQPLLITGEPGTGKTLLASRIAAEFDQPLLKFVARTTATASDLFYMYDSLRRYVDVSVNPRKAKRTLEYVRFQAFGLAILRAIGPEVNYLLPVEYRVSKAVRSVVLIDEIDKAPRDLPNDILNEIDTMEFTLKETGDRFPTFSGNEAEIRRTTFAGLRPIIIITSNDEKKLPGAFLRRCLYYHIDFPETRTEGGRKTLRTIVSTRLRGGAVSDDYLDPTYLNRALAIFTVVRGITKDRLPSTAEWVSWIRLLAEFGVHWETLGDASTKASLLNTAIVLAKSDDDRLNVQEYLAELTLAVVNTKLESLVKG